MKNLRLWSALLFLICSSISISATAQPKNKNLTPNLDTLTVRKGVFLDSVTAKKVVADLVAGDACGRELKTTKFVLKLTEKKTELQADIIGNFEKERKARIQKDNNKDVQLESREKIIKAQEKQIVIKEVVSWAWKAAAMVATASTAYLLIVN